MHSPKSCDTFAVLPPGTEENCVVFGKNSDRPHDEVQEVIYKLASDYTIPCKLKCTYIEIDQVAHTYATILSKPAWMWGAEMGANEHNVCIGNEAVWTKLNSDEDEVEKLIGMDLLRLGLERAKTANEALRVIVDLLKQYGMGGNCSDTIENFTYHNSFLIADPYEVWVLECAGNIWAAERVTSGVRNISNELSIGTQIDLASDNLLEFAIENGFWKRENGALNFKTAFSVEDEESFRYTCGKRLLTRFSENGQFKENDMFNVLRDKNSGICMSSGSFVSTGSQVSILRKPELDLPSSHWFTGTPDPCRSIFKPFIFVEDIEFPSDIVSPICDSPRVDRRHALYLRHERHRRLADRSWRQKINAVESDFIRSVNDIIENFQFKKAEAGELFNKAVNDEMSLYYNIPVYEKNPLF